jgi:carbon storage regulator
MLVLRRKAGEAIVLNGTITIHVLAVEGERVKLGISAPPEVVIVRSELLEGAEQLPAGPITAPIPVPAAAKVVRDASHPFADDERAPAIVPPTQSPMQDTNRSYPGRSGSRHRREPAGARSLPNSSRYR